MNLCEKMNNMHKTVHKNCFVALIEQKIHKLPAELGIFLVYYSENR